MLHAVIVNGGDPPHPAVTGRLPAGALLIAADSGYDHARTLGLTPSVLIGDLDSISAGGIAHAEQTGVEILRHPPEKDATDLELALLTARRRGARAVTVVAGHGDRLDHVLASVALLAAPGLAPLLIDGWFGRARLSIVRGGDHVVLAGAIGSLLTLLPYGGDARGVTITGCRYPLVDATLTPGTTWGVSNELTEPEATVAVHDGTVVAICPEALP